MKRNLTSDTLRPETVATTVPGCPRLRYLTFTTILFFVEAQNSVVVASFCPTLRKFPQVKSATCLGCDNAYKPKSYLLQRLSFHCDKSYNLKRQGKRDD